MRFALLLAEEENMTQAQWQLALNAEIQASIMCKRMDTLDHDILPQFDALAQLNVLYYLAGVSNYAD